jgi:hypothetical protein
MTDKNHNLQEWLDKWQADDNQFKFDFDDTMNTGQSGLTISSTGVDTISITGAAGSPYDFNYNTLGSGTFNIPLVTSGGGYTITSPNTTGGYGQILSTGTNGLSWNDYSNVTPGALQVRGDAEFEGDVKIKGKSINEMFEKIEERLAILHPNEKLEEKWEELRELRNRYVELEKEIIEKEKMWDILKK